MTRLSPLGLALLGLLAADSAQAGPRSAPRRLSLSPPSLMALPPLAISALNPKIQIFLERSRKTWTAPAQPGPAVQSLQTLLTVNQALSRFDVKAIKKMSAAELHGLSRELWDKTALSQTPEDPYVRNDISAGRFGDGERQKMLTIAYQLQYRINKVIKGQELAAKVLQDRLVQYLEELGTRAKDPIALHMIGLPGIGKSAILDQLNALGLPSLRIDAQKYARPDANMEYDLRNSLENYLKEEKNKGRPLILVVEELDKLPEVSNSEAKADSEKTNSLYGALNQILTDGKLSSRYPGQAPLDLSNIFIITTMNFAPNEIERFSKEILKEEKSFYDFSDEDFVRFDQWIRGESSAKYKILSRLFRSNTVSRLAPNAVILKPLAKDDYRAIAQQVADGAVSRKTTGKNSDKRLKVELSDRFVDFLAQETSYSPSGARATVSRADALTAQLINYGSKAADKGDQSLDRPRKIHIDFDAAAGAAVVTVTPRIRRGKEGLDGTSFKFNVRYDAGVGLFIQPANISIAPPPPVKTEARPAQERPLTKKKIRQARFPKTQSVAKGLAEKINAELKGQQEFTRLVEREMNAYLGTARQSLKEPPTVVLAGFPGIGKSELVNLTGKHLGLPIIRLNMQAYSSDSTDAVEAFMNKLNSAVAAAKEESHWKGKYIVLLEELDKVFELNAKGEQVNRPIMAIIKDLLNDGRASLSVHKNYSEQEINVDLRDAFLFVTMNFAVDRFGFEADPRLTSIDDVWNAWRRLKNRLSDKKQVMGSMFLPETVSRLMSKLYIMAPLRELDYKKVIELQVPAAIKQRLHDKDGKNTGQIEVKLTAAYKKYLFSETVIPSEGPRHTSKESRGKISADIEKALKSLKRSADYASQPLLITLDYKPGSSTVVASVTAKNRPNDKAQEVFRQQVPLFFPPLLAHGRMDWRRIKTALHEFGHAYLGIRLGLRFEYATVVSPKEGVNGYVKFNDRSPTAKTMLASVYANVASRAMERIFLSPDPLNGASVLDTTTGPSSDIQTATYQLYNMLYELGFDPNGGTMARLPVMSGGRYADYESLPKELVDRLGRILREMENYVVKDFTEANPREWYVEKITRFARLGGLTEKEFYEMIVYKYPGLNGVNVGEDSLLQEYFQKVIKPVSPEAKAAQEFKQGKKGTTPLENLEAFTQHFIEILNSTSKTQTK